MHNLRILVIGGSGFIGSHLLNVLRKKNFKNISSASRYLPVEMIDGVKYYADIDITKPETLKECLKDIDMVINLSGFLSFKKKDHKKLLEINNIGSLNLLEACEKSAHIQRFIHLSSTAALSIEHEKKKHQFPYSYSKYLPNEQINKSKMSTNIIYPSLVLGAGDINNTSKIASFIREKKMILVPSGGNSIIDVRDLAEGIVAVIERGINKENYVLSGEFITFKQLTKEVSCFFKQRTIIKVLPKLLAKPLFIIVKSLESIGISISSENAYFAFKDRRFTSKLPEGFKIKRSLNDTLKYALEHSKKEKYLIIFNKHSGRKKLVNYLEVITNFFKKNFIDYELLILNRESNNLPKSISNISKVLVAGGDGTLRRVVEHFFNYNIDLPISFFPLGSANVYAKTLGLPASRKKILKKLLKPKIKKMPIGLINNKTVFLIAICFGALAEITIKASREEKKYLGFFSYVLAIFKCRKFATKKFTINIDGEEKNIESHSLLIVLSESMKCFLPYKKHYLSLFYFNESSFFSLLKSFLKYFFTKQVTSNLFFGENIKKEKIFSSWHVDGDAIEDVDILSVSMTDKVMRFIV